MHNKQKIIKSGFFTFSSVLVLVVATVAWFMSSGPLNSDDVKSNLDLGSYSAVFFESPDANKDGLLDDPADWNPVTKPNIDITKMVPGEKHFYKIEVTAIKPSINFSLGFKGITVTYPAGYTSTQKEDALGRISVAFEATDKVGNPIGTDISKNLFRFFGKTDPIIADVFPVYNSLLLTNAIDEIPTKIYYTIGIDGGTDHHGDDILEGVQVDIGNIDLSVTVN